MAAKKATRGSKAPEENGDVPEAQTETTPNAVLIQRNTDADGNIGVVVQTLGDVKLTEVQTVIELGLARFREQVGLNQSQ
jgi:hypothetical protein